MNFRRFHLAAVVAAALGVAVSGCRMAGPVPERDDFASACRDAVELRQAPRTFELLSRAAGRVVDHERQLARLETAAREDFGRFDAADDPRFAWAHEMECGVLLMLAATETPPPDPEERMSSVAKMMLEFEQAVGWARFAACRELPEGSAELEAARLGLRLSTGWDDARIFGFDFDSLPLPAEKTRFDFPERTTAGRGVETLRATAALLKLATTSPPPERARFDAALKRLREARRALAESYLRRAESKLAKERDSAAALAAWRIAKARYELEKSFPGF